ncbi:hypothetical protein B0I33_105286 [Prauserella shujinwangii]|uniref:Anti-sigma factor n=1 Tax=Prauserella shujinwangii TaxID=1453103 RepID=A0A2T0LV57_9PSEU|nr:hypothetical protein [Prauserella shujinwangii]PRX47706.1 hypothetical protein B0I33_105286 [Prauserella shujinwangii]
MTDESRGHGGVVGPPWSVDVLADLHAGVLDEHEAARLWPQVNADPEARAIIEALEATTADLSALPSEPVPPMPAEVAARIDQALEQERQAGAGAPVVSLDAARRRRTRRLGWGAGLLTAAAAVVAGIVLALPAGEEAGTPNVAEPTSAPTDAPALALSGDNLGAAVGEVSGVRDFGPLGTQERLDACLSASGVQVSGRPVGVRPATIDGKRAVLALYPTGQLAQFRLVAVEPGCGPGDPGVLRDEVIGRKSG